MTQNGESYLSITSLLRDLADSSAAVCDIVEAVGLIFENKISPIQAASLLTLLHSTGLDRDATIICECAARMRNAGTPVDHAALEVILNRRKPERAEGTYSGGLCTVEGTGGDGHCTFNVSTAAAIVASAVLLVAKHGAGASSSKSGAADILSAIEDIGPLETVTTKSLLEIFKSGSFAFLFSPMFHPGSKYVAPVRKELGFPTLFNILGPLAHPLNPLIEARVVGVARRHLGPIYAEALKLSGIKKALVVCGAEQLDEISCAGRTFCWRLIEERSDDPGSSSHVRIEHFELEPADFGLPPQPLSRTPLGKTPAENSAILIELLSGKLSKDEPVSQFVLMNVAAIFVVSGICDGGEDMIVSHGRNNCDMVETKLGPGGGRWKEGMRRAHLAIESGLALRSLNTFIKFTQDSGVNLSC